MAYEEPEWLKRLRERLSRTTEEGEPEPGLAAGYQRAKGVTDAVMGALGWMRERVPGYLTSEAERWSHPVEAAKGVYEQIGSGIGEASMMAAEGLPRLYAPVAQAILPGKHGDIARYEMERAADRIRTEREGAVEEVGAPEGTAEWAGKFGGFIAPYAAMGGRVASLPVSLAADLALDVPIEAATREGSVLGMVADSQVRQAEEEGRPMTDREALLDRLADMPAARGLTGGALGLGAGGLLGALMDTGRAGQMTRRGATAAVGAGAGAAAAPEDERAKGGALGAVAALIGPEVLRDASRLREARSSVAGAGSAARRRLAEMIDPSVARELAEAYTDELTGFKNRPAWEKARRNGAEDRGVVLYFDMGNAHYSNDAQGWNYTDARFKQGSEVLARVAAEEGVDPRQLFRPAGDELIVAELPDPEVAARIGQRVSDEFGVLPITTPDGAETGFSNFFRWGVGDSFTSAAAMADAKKAEEAAAGLTGARRANAQPMVIRPAGAEAAVENVFDGIAREGHAYRGMTEAEYEATVAQGLGVHSRGDYSLSPEGTSYAASPAEAESYVNFGRDDPRRTKKPTYLVEVEAGGLNPNRQGHLYGSEPQTPVRAWMMEDVDGAIVAREIKPRTLDPAQFSQEAREARAAQQGFNRVGYHGTVNGFEEFSDLYGNPDAYFGPGHYFTTSPEDASVNYASDMGPDFASKRAMETEKVGSDWESFDEEGAVEYFRKQGRKVDSVDDLDQEEIEEYVAATRLGRTHGGAVIPARLKMDNPLIIGGENETFFPLEIVEGADGDIADFTGPAADLYRAVGRVLTDTAGAHDARLVQAQLWEHLVDYEGIAASDLERMLREVDMLEAFDDEGNLMSGGSLLREIVEQMGHDGIDMDAYAFFGPRKIKTPYGGGVQVKGMEGLNPGDRHYVVFTGHEQNIRGRFAKFHPSNVGKVGMMGFGSPNLVKLLGRTAVGSTIGGYIANQEQEGLSGGQGIVLGGIAGALAGEEGIRTFEALMRRVPGDRRGEFINLVGKWYSRIDEAIDKGPGKGTAEAWLAYLNPSKRGFPADELDWTGLRRFLSERPEGEVLTRQQVKDIVEDRKLSVQKDVLISEGDAREALDADWGSEDDLRLEVSSRENQIEEAEAEILRHEDVLTHERYEMTGYSNTTDIAQEIEDLDGIGYASDLFDEIEEAIINGQPLGPSFRKVRSQVDEWIEGLDETLDEDTIDEINDALDRLEQAAREWEGEAAEHLSEIARLQEYAEDLRSELEPMQEALDEYSNLDSYNRGGGDVAQYETPGETIQEGGHENYREILLTLDGRKASIHNYTRDGNLYFDVIAPDGRVYATTTDLADAQAKLVMASQDISENRRYVHGHWSGKRNVMVHVRVSDRTPAPTYEYMEGYAFRRGGAFYPTPEEAQAALDEFLKANPGSSGLGYEVHYTETRKHIPAERHLFIEEIQSDWHQAARKRALDAAGERWQKLSPEDKDALVRAQYESGAMVLPESAKQQVVALIDKRMERLYRRKTSGEAEYAERLTSKILNDDPLTQAEIDWYEEYQRASIDDRLWLNDLGRAFPDEYGVMVQQIDDEEGGQRLFLSLVDNATGKSIGNLDVQIAVPTPDLTPAQAAGLDMTLRRPENRALVVRDTPGKTVASWFDAVNKALRQNTLPEAPLKKTNEWVGFSIRSILQDAVDDNYRYVSWVSGEQTARMYDLRDKVEWLEYNADSHRLRALRADTGELVEETVDPKELANWVGDAPAKQLLGQVEPPAPKQPDLFGGETPMYSTNRTVRIAGGDLEVGGEGHMEFYNRVLPRQIKAELKALGVKHVEFTQVDDLVEEGRKVPFREDVEAEVTADAERELREFLLDDLELRDVVDEDSLYYIADDFGNAINTNDWLANARRLGNGDILDQADNLGMMPELRSALDRYYAARNAAMRGEFVAEAGGGNLRLEITDEIREAVRSKGTRLWNSPASIAAVTSALATQDAQDAEVNPDLNPLLKVLGIITLASVGGAAGRRVLRSKGGEAVDLMLRGRAGSPTGDAIQRVMDSAKLTAIDPDKYVNLSKFHLDPTGEARLVEEIKQVVARKGDAVLGKERVTHEQTRALAEELGLTIADLDKKAASRLTGPELLALRNVISENVAEMERVAGAIAAARQLGNPADIRYTEMLMSRLETQTDNLLAKFIKGRAEAGRTLNSMKIIAKRSDSLVTWAVMAERAKGGGLTADELVQLKALLNSGDRVKLVQFIKGLQRAPLGEKAVTLWKAGLLTNPTTHLANLTGNTTMAFLETGKDAPAKLFDMLMARWSGMDTKVGINATQIRASRDGAARGIEEAKQVMKTGVSEDDLLKYDITREVNFDNPFADTYTKVIFRSLNAGDRVFRGAAFMRSLAEQAQLYARAEGYTGAKLHARVRELIDRPLDEMVLRATTDAEVATFLNRGILGEAGKKLRGVLGPVGEAIMPFVMTPANVATRVVEYAGGGAVRPFLPIGPQSTRHGLKLDWQTPDFIEFIKLARRNRVNGLSPEELSKLYGLQKQMVEGFGRSVLGVGAIAIGWELASNNLLTGNWPNEQNEQELMQQSDLPTSSIRVATGEEGGTWLAIDRISPLGNLLVLGAELHRLSINPDANAGSLLAGGAAGIANTLTSQSFLRGIQGVLDAMNDPDYSAYKFMKDQAASTVPSVVAATARAIDPTMRETQTISQAVMARIPFASKTLPARIDALGEQRSRPGGLLGAVSQTVLPFRVAEDNLGDDVRAELYKYGVGITVYRPQAIKATDGSTIEPPERGTQEYADIQQRYGRAAQEEIEKVMATPTYQRATDEEKAEKLSDAVTAARRKVTAARKREYRAAS